MNLQETIRRVLREMIINESSEKPQEIVKTNINQILAKLKSDASRRTKGVINAKAAIDEFGDYLINRIPEILEKSKTGKNGEQFAFECYNKVSEILDNQLKDISDMKRFFIRKLAPSEKDKFIKNSSNPNLYDLYFYFLEQMIDFPYQVGYLPEFDKVSENMAKFSSQITDYIDRNRTKIINNFVNKVANFLYK